MFYPCLNAKKIQAEMEELARRVESLTAENAALKSEINQLVENSQKLRRENATLTVIKCPISDDVLCYRPMFVHFCIFA